MKKFVMLSASLAFVILSMLGNSPSVQAAAYSPGCYVQRGPGNAPVACAEIQAVYPGFTPNSAKCYISDGMNSQIDGYGEPYEFDCSQEQDPTGPVTTGPAPLSATPATEEESAPATEETAPAETTPTPAPTAAQTQIRVSDDTGNPAWACGGGTGFEPVNPAFDIGCRGQGNPIIDMLFAFIRIITTGVGFALVISIIIAGVQYTTAAGDANKTAQAKQRMVSTILIALPLYLLTYAILNWLIPGIVL